MSADSISSRPRRWARRLLALLLIIVLGVARYRITNAILDSRPIGQTQALEKVKLIDMLLTQYAIDNNGVYPSGKNSTEVFQKLIDGKYADDPALFYFPMSGKVKPTSDKLTPENVCWDVVTPVEDADSDLVPIVISTGYRVTFAPGGKAVLLSSAAFAVPGIAIGYKGANSGTFLKTSESSAQEVPNAVSSTFDAKGKAFQQLTPTGPLEP